MFITGNNTDTFSTNVNMQVSGCKSTHERCSLFRGTNHTVVFKFGKFSYSFLLFFKLMLLIFISKFRSFEAVLNPHGAQEEALFFQRIKMLPLLRSLKNICLTKNNLISRMRESYFFSKFNIQQC